jgi:molybdopterin biosynthesis enzyme
MISVQDGQNQILRQLTEPTPPEVVAVTRARDRVLAEDLPAPFDVPPTATPWRATTCRPRTRASSP